MIVRMLVVMIGLAAVCGAQEAPTLEELEAERAELQRQLELNQVEMERAGGTSDASPELREWQIELQEELDKVGRYLEDVPRELTMYYTVMQKALGDMLTAIEEGVDETRESAREKIASAERRYWGAREKAYNQERLRELRERAASLGASDEAAGLIETFAESLAAVDQARANAAAAEAEVELRRKEAELAGRKLELRLMEIETRRMEEALTNQGG